MPRDYEKALNRRYPAMQSAVYCMSGEGKEFEKVHESVNRNMGERGYSEISELWMIFIFRELESYGVVRRKARFFNPTLYSLKDIPDSVGESIEEIVEEEMERFYHDHVMVW